MDARNLSPHTMTAEFTKETNKQPPKKSPEIYILQILPISQSHISTRWQDENIREYSSKSWGILINFTFGELPFDLIVSFLIYNKKMNIMCLTQLS